LLSPWEACSWAWHKMFLFATFFLPTESEFSTDFRGFFRRQEKRLSAFNIIDRWTLRNVKKSFCTAKDYFVRNPIFCRAHNWSICHRNIYRGKHKDIIDHPIWEPLILNLMLSEVCMYQPMYFKTLDLLYTILFFSSNKIWPN
jgi:hypothetical protein